MQAWRSSRQIRGLCLVGVLWCPSDVQFVGVDKDLLKFDRELVKPVFKLLFPRSIQLWKEESIGSDLSCLWIEIDRRVVNEGRSSSHRENNASVKRGSRYWIVQLFGIRSQPEDALAKPYLSEVEKQLRGLPSTRGFI